MHRRAARYHVSFAVAAAIAQPVAAWANEVCVDTADALQAELDKASDGGIYSGGNNFIFVVANTYHTGLATGGNPFHYTSTAAGSLTLAGGFNSGCTTQTLDATLTKLDGSNATRVMEIHSTQGEVDVSWFTIQDGHSASDGGGLSINYNAGDNGAVSVLNNIIQNNSSDGQAGGLIAATGGSHLLFVQNNLIVGNTAAVTAGAGTVLGNGAGALVANNTVTQNTATGPSSFGGLYYGGGGPGTLANNIFSNNTTSGLHLGTAALLLYNDYGTLTGVTPDPSSTGNLSVSAKFVDAAGGDFHLSSASPLLATCPTRYGGPDLDGNAYPANGPIDMGAFEETVFIAGFDGG